MSCRVCGSNANCGCTSCVTDPALPCGGNVTAGGCCQNVVAPTPTPYYACAPACPESHMQKVIIQSFSADIKIQDSWNVPVCNGSAIINSISLRAVVVGSYIWNPAYGYFQITAFNSGTGQITVLNNCNAGNASPGTNIPACTEFTVTVPPCDCADSSQICVAIDFTAPANGDCIDITLTATQGIQVSFLVQIGSGQYRVSAIKPNDIITICNDGAGIAPGTPVIAKNSAGQYQYCLQIIESNPCEADTITEGVLIVCDGSDLLKPLTGAVANTVLTLVNPVTGDAEYETLQITKYRDSITTTDSSVPFTLNHTATTHDTPLTTYILTTGDRAIDLIVNVRTSASYTAVNGNTSIVNFTGIVQTQLNGGGYSIIEGVVGGPIFTASNSSTAFINIINGTHIFLNLAANTTHTIDLKFSLTWSGDNTASAVFSSLIMDTQFLGL